MSDGSKPAPVPECLRDVLREKAAKAIQKQGAAAVIAAWISLVHVWNAAAPLRGDESAFWTEASAVRDFLAKLRTATRYALPPEARALLEGFDAN